MDTNAVIIGSFQPFHNGHVDLVKEALKNNDRVTIIVLDEKCSVHSPWSSVEVWNMIALSLTNDIDRIAVSFVENLKYDDRRFYIDLIDEIKQVKNPILWTSDYGNIEYNLVLRTKIPVYKYAIVSDKAIKSSQIRKDFVSGEPELINDKVHPEVFNYLIQNRTDNAIKFIDLYNDHHFSESYKSTVSKYDPVYMTADAVVTRSDGKVLLVTRGKNPGMDKLALPGGFLDKNERLENAAIRELIEETKINIPNYALQKKIVANKVFDDPKRSLRGRVITNAFHFDLSDYSNTITVEGADDAKKADWYDLRDLNGEVMFEDHYAILMHFFGNNRVDWRTKIDRDLSEYYQSNLNVIINSDHDDYAIIQVGDKTFKEGYDMLQWEGIRKLTTRVDAYLERLV